ncbi:MAG: hypothetical protein AAFV95_15570 [Bacteroidota bacterium]
MKQLTFLMLGLWMTMGLEAQDAKSFISISAQTNLRGTLPYTLSPDINFHREDERFSFGWQLIGSLTTQETDRPDRRNALNTLQLGTGPQAMFYRFISKDRKWQLFWRFGITMSMQTTRTVVQDFDFDVRVHRVGPLRLSANPGLQYHLNRHWAVVAYLGDISYSRFFGDSRRRDSNDLSLNFDPSNSLIGLRYSFRRDQ